MRILKIIWRVILIIVLAAIAVPILLGVIKQYVGNSSTTPPTITEAPFEIKTTSRIYYGQYFQMDNGTPELKNYWSLDGSNYHYHKGIIAFPLKSYGKFGKDVILVERIAGTK